MALLGHRLAALLVLACRPPASALRLADTGQHQADAAFGEATSDVNLRKLKDKTMEDIRKLREKLPKNYTYNATHVGPYSHTERTTMLRTAFQELWKRGKSNVTESKTRAKSGTGMTWATAALDTLYMVTFFIREALSHINGDDVENDFIPCPLIEMFLVLVCWYVSGILTIQLEVKPAEKLADSFYNLATESYNAYDNNQDMEIIKRAFLSLHSYLWMAVTSRYMSMGLEKLFDCLELGAWSSGLGTGWRAIFNEGESIKRVQVKRRDEKTVEATEINAPFRAFVWIFIDIVLLFVVSLSMIPSMDASRSQGEAFGDAMVMSSFASLGLAFGEAQPVSVHSKVGSALWVPFLQAGYRHLNNIFNGDLRVAMDTSDDFPLLRCKCEKCDRDPSQMCVIKNRLYGPDGEQQNDDPSQVDEKPEAEESSPEGEQSTTPSQVNRDAEEVRESS